MWSLSLTPLTSSLSSSTSSSPLTVSFQSINPSAKTALPSTKEPDIGEVQCVTVQLIVMIKDDQSNFGKRKRVTPTCRHVVSSLCFLVFVFIFVLFGTFSRLCICTAWKTPLCVHKWWAVSAVSVFLCLYLYLVHFLVFVFDCELFCLCICTAWKKTPRRVPKWWAVSVFLWQSRQVIDQLPQQFHDGTILLLFLLLFISSISVDATHHLLDSRRWNVWIWSQLGIHKLKYIQNLTNGLFR